MPDFSMTDAAFKKEKARVQAAVDRWFNTMGFRMWQRVEIAYWREPLINDGGESTEAVADCKADWKYLCAHVRFCLPQTVDQDDDQIDYIVRHEFMHAIVNELRQEPWTDEALEHEERVVTQLAMVLGWVRDQGTADAAVKRRR